MIKDYSIQTTKITSKFAYENTLYDFSYIKYKYKIFISKWYLEGFDKSSRNVIISNNFKVCSFLFLHAADLLRLYALSSACAFPYMSWKFPTFSACMKVDKKQWIVKVKQMYYVHIFHNCGVHDSLNPKIYFKLVFYSLKTNR